jgi:hypothetical protein
MIFRLCDYISCFNLFIQRSKKIDSMLDIKFVKNIILLFWIILLSFPVEANFLQKEKEPWFTSKDLMIRNKTYFELFGGAVYSNMTYSLKSLNNVERNPQFLYDAGISLRFQRGKWYSFSPRLTLLNQGVSMKDKLEYRFNANYLSFSFPVELQFDLSDKMNSSVSRMFFYITPYIATPISVHISSNEYSNWLLLSEMKTINWGGEAGIGLRIPTFSLEGRSNILVRLSYLRGFNNTYTRFEKNITVQSQRDQLYVIDGKRFNSAIKLTIGVEIPLKNKKLVSFTAGGNGKKNFKRVVVVDEK